MAIDIGGEIEDILEDFSEKINQTVNDSGKIAANVAKRTVKIGAYKDRTGKYRKSWKIKKEKQITGVNKYTVHAGDEYPLTHLLEFGHATRNGGRTKAYPHIKTAETAAKQTFVSEVVKRIEK